MSRGWSFAHERRVRELAKAGKSLEQAAKIMDRKPETIRAAAIRLGVSFGSNKEPRVKRGPEPDRK